MGKVDDGEQHSLYDFYDATTGAGQFAITLNTFHLIFIVACTFFYSWGINLYFPNLMFYQYYAPVWSISCYSMEVYFHTRSNIYVKMEAVFAVVSLFSMGFYLNELASGSAPLDKFSGVTTYSQQKNLLTMKNGNPSANGNLGLYTAEIALAAVTFAFSFARIFVAILTRGKTRTALRKELRRKKYITAIRDIDSEYPTEEILTDLTDQVVDYPSHWSISPNVDRWRLGCAILSLFVLFVGFLQMFVSMFWLWSAILPITLFSNQFTLLYFCIFLALDPPPPVLPPGGLWSVDETINRRQGKRSTWHTTYICLFAAAIGAAFINESLSMHWRRSYGIISTTGTATPEDYKLPLVCNGTISIFANLITYNTTLLYPTNQIVSTSVTPGATFNALLLGSWTCFDDLWSLILCFFALVIWSIQLKIYLDEHDYVNVQNDEGNVQNYAKVQA